MPLQMKIQPLDAKAATARSDPAKKSRLKRLLERQFPGVQRISSSEKLFAAADKDNGYLEPSSMCLDRMVLSFIDESNEKPLSCRCNYFNGNCDDSSDDEFADLDASVTVSAAEILKGLVPCASMAEWNLLADTAKLAEKGKISKGKDGCRWIVMRERRRELCEVGRAVGDDPDECGTPVVVSLHAGTLERLVGRVEVEDGGEGEGVDVLCARGKVVVGAVEGECVEVDSVAGGEERAEGSDVERGG